MSDRRAQNNCQSSLWRRDYFGGLAENTLKNLSSTVMIGSYFEPWTV